MLRPCEFEIAAVTSRLTTPNWCMHPRRSRRVWLSASPLSVRWRSEPFWPRELPRPQISATVVFVVVALVIVRDPAHQLPDDARENPSGRAATA
jgi:hypothetical protein